MVILPAIPPLPNWHLGSKMSGKVATFLDCILRRKSIVVANLHFYSLKAQLRKNGHEGLRQILKFKFTDGPTAYARLALFQGARTLFLRKKGHATTPL